MKQWLHKHFAISRVEVDQRFDEGLKAARTYRDFTAAIAWREYNIKHPFLGPLRDLLATTALMIGRS